MTPQVKCKLKNVNLEAFGQFDKLWKTKEGVASAAGQVHKQDFEEVVKSRSNVFKLNECPKKSKWLMANGINDTQNAQNGGYLN